MTQQNPSTLTPPFSMGVACRRTHAGHHSKRSKQSGFTMVELLVVIVLLGVFAKMAVPIFADGQKMGDATSYYDVASRVSTAWQFGTSKCQVSNIIGTSPVTTTKTEAAHMTLLVEGTGAADAYKGCWASAKVEPLNRSGVRGGTGAYLYNGSTITIASNAVAPARVAVSFTGVDESVVLDLVQKYSGNTTAATLETLPTAADTTDTSVQYSGGTAGSPRTLTIIK